MPPVFTADQTGRKPICRPAKHVSTPSPMQRSLVGVELDSTAFDGSEAHPQSLARALDRGLVARKRGAMNALRLIGDDVPHEANHRWEAFRSERARRMKPDGFARRFVRQVEPP
jgi:hypothetical protein